MDNGKPHISEDDIVRYRDRKMPQAELLAADRHLALCDACHRRLVEWSGMDEMVGGAARAFDRAVSGEVTHLTYEQLVAMVDDQIDDIDREILTSHLDMCAPCETELNDLRELRSTISIAPPAKVAKKQGAGGKRSLQEWVMTFGRQPTFSLLALAAVVAVAVVSFLITIPLRRENAEARARIAELEKSNASLRERSEASDSLQNEMAGLREDNERLRRAAETQAVVALNDGGGRVILDAQGNLSGLQTAANYEQSVRDALQTGRVKTPAVFRMLRGTSGTLMGGRRAEFSLVSPVGMVVESDRPAFRWSELAGATSYTVTVFDESLTRIETSDALTTTEWTGSKPLPRGKTYIWQVRAVRETEEVVAPSASQSRVKFRVLDPSTVDEIRRAKTAHANSHLTMGIIYAEAGLLEDAEREFSDLVQANPQSPVARKLLRSVTAAGR